MLIVMFKVDGLPKGKARPRFARRGNFVSTYTPKSTLEYEDFIVDKAKRAMGASEPFKTDLEAFIYISMPVPKSYPKKRREACLIGAERPSKKPDIDNIIKAYLDAMNGIVYDDDTQIVDLHATKVYGEPFVEIMIREAE